MLLVISKSLCFKEQHTVCTVLITFSNRRELFLCTHNIRFASFSLFLLKNLLFLFSRFPPVERILLFALYNFVLLSFGEKFKKREEKLKNVFIAFIILHRFYTEKRNEKASENAQENLFIQHIVCFDVFVIGLKTRKTVEGVNCVKNLSFIGRIMIWKR